MATFISNGPEATHALGVAWGREAQPGWLIGLSGDLGAGKTQLVRGLAAGLACRSRVHSPTFTLVNVYEGGRLPLVHLDFYRLTGLDQIIAAGLEDYLAPDGVAVVEWMERWTSDTNEDWRPGGGTRFRRVRIETIGEEERRIDYDDVGH